jgi:hypothetical protein
MGRKERLGAVTAKEKVVEEATGEHRTVAKELALTCD